MNKPIISIIIIVFTNDLLGDMEMELRHLDYFITMCEELHFTKAAQKLGISQPTLSQQIRALEQNMDTPLFDRVGKKVIVTEAGKILYRHCLQVFNELGQAQMAIRELEGLNKGEIRIGCSGNHLLLPSIIAFHEKYPGIMLQVSELSTEETKRGLLNNELDLGVVFLPIEDDQIDSISLYTENLALVVPASHPLAGLKEIELQTLQTQPMALLPHKFFVRQMIDRAAKKNGFSFLPVLEMSTLDSLVKIVAQGTALTILPETYISGIEQEPIRKISIINPTPQRSVGIVYRNNKYISAATKVFIEYIKERLPHS